MVLSLVLNSTTVIDAAGIADEWSYVLYDTATGIIMVSEQPLMFGQSTVISTVGSSGANYVWYGEKPFNYAYFNRFANNYVYGWLYCVDGSSSTGLIDAWLLYPIEVDGTVHYTSYAPMQYYSTNDNNSLTYVLTQDFNLTTITGNYTPSGYSGTVGPLPDDIGGGQSVEDVLNEILAQTAIGNQAETISSNIDSTRASYEAGTITAEEASAQLNTYSAQLDTLNSTAGATVTDLLQVNNAQNNLDYTQDQVLQDQLKNQLNDQLQTGSSIASAVNAAVASAQSTFDQYETGAVTQSQAMASINSQIEALSGLITADTPVADLTAINNGITALNGIKESVADYGDLDQTISKEAQTSFAEEVTYLDEMVETVASITDLDDGIEDSDVTSFNQVAGKLWDMEIFKLIIPVAGIMMVISVALGVKYRL